MLECLMQLLKENKIVQKVKINLMLKNNVTFQIHILSTSNKDIHLNKRKKCPFCRVRSHYRVKCKCKKC